ncbi:MAG: Xaa-Pro aminopeptidase [Parcubacteria group bacterium Greene0714_36]|nr:MAG: Xaa-Pro aminopeptidase [Parcubacteria group bacterium Greene0714_36]
MHKSTRLLYGATDLRAPHFSADLLWRTGFRVPDPLFLAEVGGKTVLLASPLEAGRAEKEADVDRVVRVAGKGLDAVTTFLKERGVRQIEIPEGFPYGIAVALKKEFAIIVGREPWYPERAIKTSAEIKEIEKAQHATERAFDRVVAFLRECRIGGKILHYGNHPATSEMARKIIDDALWEKGYLATDTIVAGGAQAADPHCIGSGVLPARVPIVIDIFPVSLATHYYADMARTVFKGEPTKESLRMYETVRTAQESAIKKIRAGADGRIIYNGVRDYFSAEGYETRLDGKTSEGFIHGLGHGVGMEIHEYPRLGSVREILEEGNVVTVEPGLYYPGVGGIRIEDMILVTRRGYRDLAKSAKDLASVIII